MTDTERDAAVRAVTVERFGDAPPTHEQERTDQRGAVIAAIRALADFYETNPGMPVPRDVVANSYVTRDIFDAATLMLGITPYGPAARPQADLDLLLGQPCWVTARLVVTPAYFDRSL